MNTSAIDQPFDRNAVTSVFDVLPGISNVYAGEEMQTMSDHHTVPHKSIWPILGGMRFFFAFWVLCAHTYNFGPHDRAMPVPSHSGLIAVICFFAISGFSIRHSIDSEPAGYYRRRVARIVPTHLAAVGLTFIAYLIFGTLQTGAGAAYPMPGALKWVAYLTLLNLLILPAILDALFPLWSLSIEAVYYAIAPKLRGRPAALVLASILASGAIWIGFSLAGKQNIWLAPYGSQVFVFAWAWLTGWLAYSARGRLGYALVCATVGCFAIWSNPSPFWLVKSHVYYWTYGSWLATVAILFFPPSAAFSLRARTGLNYLGDLSFPLYLIHYPVLFTISTALWRNHPATNFGWVQAVLALAAAHLVLVLIDRPLRRKLSSRPADFGRAPSWPLANTGELEGQARADARVAP